MVRSCFAWLAFLAFFGVVAPEAEARKWTDTQGRSIEGEYVRLVGDIVLVDQGGKVLRVPIASLSEPDRDFLRGQNPGKRIGKVAPKPDPKAEPTKPAIDHPLLPEPTAPKPIAKPADPQPLQLGPDTPEGTTLDDFRWWSGRGEITWGSIYKIESSGVGLVYGDKSTGSLRFDDLSESQRALAFSLLRKHSKVALLSEIERQGKGSSTDENPPPDLPWSEANLIGNPTTHWHFEYDFHQGTVRRISTSSLVIIDEKGQTHPIFYSALTRSERARLRTIVSKFKNREVAAEIEKGEADPWLPIGYRRFEGKLRPWKVHGETLQARLDSICMRGVELVAADGQQWRFEFTRLDEADMKYMDEVGASNDIFLQFRRFRKDQQEELARAQSPPASPSPSRVAVRSSSGGPGRTGSGFATIEKCPHCGANYVPYALEGEFCKGCGRVMIHEAEEEDEPVELTLGAIVQAVLFLLVVGGIGGLYIAYRVWRVVRHFQ